MVIPPLFMWRKMKNKAEELADKHWEFIEGLLKLWMGMAKYLFKRAIVHGYKHGMEDKE